MVNVIIAFLYNFLYFSAELITVGLFWTNTSFYLIEAITLRTLVLSIICFWDVCVCTAVTLSLRELVWRDGSQNKCSDKYISVILLFV